MKKLFFVALLCVVLSGYGLSLSIGGAYENLYTGDTLDKAFFALKGDLAVDILPLLTWRAGILNVEFPEGITSFVLGTGISSDILINLPLPLPLKLYGVTGFVFSLKNASDSTKMDVTYFKIKGGLGAKMSIMPMLSVYVEGGVDYYSTNIKIPATSYDNTETTHPIYITGGVCIPIPLGK
uniref:Outer membrane protein beta-barrel domain-containing protein n=1 Tax=candidate division WOR-3 bacterium TaxID=2052148 RepID=A0A7C4YAG8_UNCW3